MIRVLARCLSWRKYKGLHTPGPAVAVDPFPLLDKVETILQIQCAGKIKVHLTKTVRTVFKEPGPNLCFEQEN